MRNLLAPAFIVTAVLVGFVLSVHGSIFDGYFWHPLRTGNGYNVWSGVLGSFLFSIPAFTAAGIAWWHTHNCHVHGCWRLQWHRHPEHGHPVCAVHHPQGHRGLIWRVFHGKCHDLGHVLNASTHRYNHHC